MFVLPNHTLSNHLKGIMGEDAIERILQDLRIKYQRDVRTTKHFKTYCDIDFILKRWYAEVKHFPNWVTDKRTVDNEVDPRFSNAEKAFGKKKQKLLILISPNKPTKEAFKLLRQSNTYLIWVKKLEDVRHALIEFIFTHIRIHTDSRYIQLVNQSINRYLLSFSRFICSIRSFTYFCRIRLNPFRRFSHFKVDFLDFSDLKDLKIGGDRDEFRR